MITIRSILGDDADDDALTQRLQDAYQAWAAGNASVADYELVLQDLLKFTGYYGTTPTYDVNGVAVPDQVLQRAEGRREVMGRICWMLDIPINQLREAARNAATE